MLDVRAARSTHKFKYVRHQTFACLRFGDTSVRGSAEQRAVSPRAPGALCRQTPQRAPPGHKPPSRPQVRHGPAGRTFSWQLPRLCQLPVQPLHPKATGTQGAQPSRTEARPLALWLRHTPLLRSFIHPRGEAGDLRVAALLPLSRTHAAGREHQPRPVPTGGTAGLPALTVQQQGREQVPHQAAVRDGHLRAPCPGRQHAQRAVPRSAPGRAAHGRR